MCKKIVVMGGSFNPPTVAHHFLMKTALDLINADLGYFVPVSYPYLKRKMLRSGCSHLCLPDELRLSMLRAICLEDDRLQIDESEMSEVCSVTKLILQGIAERYPNARIFFLSGADKLSLLENFTEKWDFLPRFGAIIFSRNAGDVEEELRNYERLNAHRDSIVTATLPNDMAFVSSTAIREHLFDIESVSDMLHPATIPFLKTLISLTLLKVKNGICKKLKIDFRRPYDTLGNC